MPKQFSKSELDALVTFVGMSPKGVKAEDIRRGLSLTISPRALQRRLKRLADAGRIMTEGSGTGTRYLPAAASTMPPKDVTASTSAVGVIPLSPASEEIKKIITQPLAARTPVGYRGEFLDAYIPNETFYLSVELRQELERIGQVGISNLPAGTYIRRIMHRLLIDLSWNSSRLEGNTYSLLETQRLLDLGETAEGKTAQDAQMILNHKAAIEMLADRAEEIGFNRYTICNLHALLADNLLADPAACGRLRSLSVGIGGTVFHPLEVPQQIEEHFQEILTKATAIADPFEQAFFVMVHLPYLQPFEDVNKRVSRLAANIPLARHNLCPLSFIDVPQEDYVNGIVGVYELNRVEYMRDVFIWAYRRSAARYAAVRQSLGEPDPFRLRNRSKIGEFVRTVVQGKMDKSQATQWIAQQAAGGIPKPDRAKFIEVVETELSSLHEGNIARYQLRPGEFNDWEEGWK
jgi:hypothetical protein